MQNISYGGGLRAIAATTTAAFRPIDDGLITEVDKSLVVDHNKVERVQDYWNMGRRWWHTGSSFWMPEEDTYQP